MPVTGGEGHNSLGQPVLGQMEKRVSVEPSEQIEVAETQTQPLCRRHSSGQGGQHKQKWLVTQKDFSISVDHWCQSEEGPSDFM